MAEPSFYTDVLIVGSGPSGGTAAACLSMMGISNVLIDKYSSTAPTPRAHITNQRTMEVFRDLGIEDAARAIATPQDSMAEHVYARDLVGEEIGRMLTWYNHPRWKMDHDLASPCSVCDLPQTEMEPLLVRTALQSGSVIRWLTEYLGHEQDRDGVTVYLRDRLEKRDYAVRCRYLIGCDGAKSQVAEDAGLSFVSKTAKGGSIGVYFKGDLSQYVSHRRGDMYWLLQPGNGMGGHGVGVLRMVKPWDHWVATAGYDEETGPPELTHELAKKIIFSLIGENRINVDVLDISTWTVNDVYATAYSKSRVICVGDAVHRHPPMNGLGSNTCVGDAYNLSWKLALVLKGQAGAGLLDSYSLERQPVGEYVVKRANKSMGTIPPLVDAMGLSGVQSAEAHKAILEKRKEKTADGAAMRLRIRKAIDATLVGFNTLGAELNQRYSEGAFVSDGSLDPGFAKDRDFHHQPGTRPGWHLPHVWLLDRRQRKVSSLDLCGQGRFTVLTGIGGEAWIEAAAASSERLSVDIQCHMIGPGHDHDDIYGDYATMREIEEDGALLIRPDMFIGWRAQTSAQSNNLEAVMRQILALPPQNVE